ncbi:VanZ family protein [Caldibacillus thermolactis]|jgi:hypothetical protein|uniref:VanZ family protein n=1 Tax=Pallidibacillus thermolactis TaxID=251051 RepID=A0ABT2WGT7_9BACI|nr:VanZ family protein [Pallidibacillus thermolactis]MCU9594151.1 VanZ family protein [Pallidibacillus thermolactis]
MKFIRIVLKVLPFTYMSFIWLLSSKPADAYIEFRVYDGFIKESLHLVEFGILYGLFVLYFLVDGKLTMKTSIFSAIVASMWGLIDEIHQSFVPYRSADVIDLVKDVIGVIVGFIIVHFSYIKRKNRLGAWMDRLAFTVNKERKQF